MGAAETAGVVALPQPDIQEEFEDFDAAVEELKPSRFKIKGKFYELSPDVPAEPLLVVLRNQTASMDEKEKLQVGLRLVELAVGKEDFKQILADGTGMKQLSLLAGWVQKKYGLSEDSKLEGGDDERPPE